jgi:hypothetical protein
LPIDNSWQEFIRARLLWTVLQKLAILCRLRGLRALTESVKLFH